MELASKKSLIQSPFFNNLWLAHTMIYSKFEQWSYRFQLALEEEKIKIKIAQNIKHPQA